MTWQGPVSAQVHSILVPAAGVLQGRRLPVGWGHWRAPLEGPPGQGLAAWGHPTAQPGAGQLGGTGAAPATGIGHLPGDGPRLSRDMGLQVGPAQQGLWPGRAERWGAGD